MFKRFSGRTPSQCFREKGRPPSGLGSRKTRCAKARYRCWVSGRANDTIYFCPQQRSERVPEGTDHCPTSLLEPYRQRGAGPHHSSLGDGHRPFPRDGHSGHSSHSSSPGDGHRPVCCCKRLKKCWSRPQADPAAPHKALVSLRKVSDQASDTMP